MPTTDDDDGVRGHARKVIEKHYAGFAPPEPKLKRRKKRKRIVVDTPVTPGTLIEQILRFYDPKLTYFEVAEMVEIDQYRVQRYLQKRGLYCTPERQRIRDLLKEVEQLEILLTRERGR